MFKINKLLSVGILAASLAGCGYFDYAVEPAKEIKPIAKDDSCVAIVMDDGMYAGMIEGKYVRYEVKGKRCKLYTQLNETWGALYDSGCDDVFDALYLDDGKKGTIYRGNLKEEDLGKLTFQDLDNLLKKGRGLVCSKNKNSWG